MVSLTQAGEKQVEHEADYEAENQAKAVKTLEEEKQLAQQKADAAIAQQEQENAMAVYNADIQNKSAQIVAEVNLNKL